MTGERIGHSVAGLKAVVRPRSINKHITQMFGPSNADVGDEPRS
jgi:hypothetical protein